MALFPPGKGGGEEIEVGHKGKGSTMHLLVEAGGAPLAVATGAANLDERVFVEYLLDQIHVHPVILHADKGYDASWLRDLLFYMGISPIISRRKWPSGGPEAVNRNYRWVVERTFAWLQKKFRRLVVRWERKQSVWNGFVNMGFIAFWLEKIVG